MFEERQKEGKETREERYKNEAVRIRLEAEEENIHAVRMYRKQGYQVLPYLQMTKENS